MAQLTTAEYDALERAIVDRRRIAVLRHGRELVAVPIRIVQTRRGEAIEARHPSTGESMLLLLADVDELEVVDR